jgi:predicted nucleotidyltransferase
MHTSVREVVSIARAIGALADEVVFVGGAVAPLLHTERVLADVRATKDVDGIVASATYGDVERVARILRARGFTHVAGSAAHMYRWRSPALILFDLVPAGEHTGGTGSELDALALRSPVVVTIDSVAIRHVSAATFIALKLEAYNDRGNGDVHASHDIEDVIALIASRPSIVDDVLAAEPMVRKRIASFAALLMASDIADDILTGHLNNADDLSYAVRAARSRLRAIAEWLQLGANTQTA